MMKFLLTCSLILISLQIYCQRTITSSSNSSRYLTLITDPVTNVEWASVCINLRSNRTPGPLLPRQRAELEFLSSSKAGSWELLLRFKMSTGIKEWPLDQQAYLIVNGQNYEIQLADIMSKYYHIQDETASVDTSGMIMTSVETRDFQLFRKETDVTAIFNNIKFINSLQLVVYNGRKPLIFDFTNNDLDKIQAILK